jgi:hypothetical protein
MAKVMKERADTCLLAQNNLKPCSAAAYFHAGVTPLAANHCVVEYCTQQSHS